jgi:PBP1b-binding outer membrane lipoprotein LpoB
MRRTLIVSVLACSILGFVGCSSQSEPAPPVEVEMSEPGLQLDPEENPNAALMEALAAEILGSPTSESDATALIESEGFTARVTERDGEPLPATMDYRIDRFNLTVVDGIVTELSVG